MVVFSQKPDTWYVNPADSTRLEYIDYSQNLLQNTTSLQPFLNKLFALKTEGKENAIIVHLGDSHIQADMMTVVIRNEFQRYFGNAGRGIVFPFQVVKSNAPSDLIFNSKSLWKGNRVAKIDTTPSCGISGFGMQSQNTNAGFNFEFRTINENKEKFDKIHFFMGGKVTDLLLEYNDYEIENYCYETPIDFTSIDLKNETSGFKVTFTTNDTINFYGASLEKKFTKGVIYHSIGANGAKYSDYTKTPLFWQQLKQLHADCYVISLGTNEAQNQNLTAEDFMLEMKMMVDKIKIVSPNATIIISTPPVSYFRKIKPNPVLTSITNTIIDYCTQNNLVYWDLYRISKGAEGTRNWKNKQLLRPDLVHYSKEGYVLQGNLLAKAFAASWNEFLSKK